MRFALPMWGPTWWAERFWNWCAGLWGRTWWYHIHYEEGTYWADSKHHPGFTAAAPTLPELEQLIREVTIIEKWGRTFGLVDAEAARADVERRRREVERRELH